MTPEEELQKELEKLLEKSVGRMFRFIGRGWVNYSYLASSIVKVSKKYVEAKIRESK